MKHLTGKDLKDYFRDPYLVTTWWRPEEGRYAFWHEQEFRILDKYLKISPNWTVLDAACGQGRFARYFAKKGCRVHAFDINAKMLQIAKKRAIREGPADHIEFFENDLEKKLFFCSPKVSILINQRNLVLPIYPFESSEDTISA